MSCIDWLEGRELIGTWPYIYSLDWDLASNVKRKFISTTKDLQILVDNHSCRIARTRGRASVAWDYHRVLVPVAHKRGKLNFSAECRENGWSPTSQF